MMHYAYINFTVWLWVCVICQTFRLCGIRHKSLMKLSQDDVKKMVKRVVGEGKAEVLSHGHKG